MAVEFAQPVGRHQRAAACMDASARRWNWDDIAAFSAYDANKPGYRAVAVQAATLRRLRDG